MDKEILRKNQENQKKKKIRIVNKNFIKMFVFQKIYIKFCL